MKKLLLRMSITSAFCLPFSAALADISPYVPHFYMSYFGGNADGSFANLGSADLLAPIYTNASRNLFLYGQGRVSNDNVNDGTNTPYQLSGGIGYRQLGNLRGSPRIFGAYVLTDYNGSPYGHKYWDISPGIETLGEKLDLRANAYFPLGDKKYTVDDFEFDHFTGNSEYDKHYKAYEESATGFDAEIGGEIFKVKDRPLKLFVGGYNFSTEDNGSITGGSGRLTFDLTKNLSLEVKDTYDNEQHNVALAGLTLHLNGIKDSSNQEDDITKRLYDAVKRNTGSIGTANSVPIIKGDPINEGTEVVRDHIVFTKEENAAENNMEATDAAQVSGSGTYEDPYIYTSGNMQTVVDDAHNEFSDYSYLYFSPGSYDMGSSTVNLFDGQSLWGREGDANGFASPADTDGTVTFYGSFAANNVSDLGFHDFSLLNNGQTNATGIYIDNSAFSYDANIMFDGVTVGEIPKNIGDADPLAFSHGVWIRDNTDNHDVTATIDDSKMYGYSTAMPTDEDNWSSYGFGFEMYNGGNIAEINNSTFNGISLYDDAAGFDITAHDKSVKIGDITNSDFSATSFSDADSSSLGFYVFNNNADITIGNISGSNFTATREGSRSYGFYAQTANKGDITIGNISDSNFTGTIEGEPPVVTYSFGLFAVSDANLTIGNISGSKFSVAKGATNDGFDAKSNANMTIGNISDSSFSAVDGGTNYGFNVVSGANMTIGNIIDSSFNAVTAGEGGDGFSFAAQTKNGGNLTIGNIIDSQFTGTAIQQGNSLGFDAESDGYLTIGNISDSDFNSSTTGTGYGGSFDFTVESNKDLTIGNISNSNFSASVNNSSAFQGAGFSVQSFGADVTIGNISNSSFTASIDGDGRAKGFYTYGNNVTIGDILNSNFVSNNNGHGDSYGFFAESSENMTIGNILSSSFVSNNNGDGGSYGFLAKNSENITIGNIVDSNFVANADDSGSAVSFAGLSNGDLTIGDIVNSNFVANGAGNTESGSYDLGFMAQSVGNLTIGNIRNSNFSALGSKFVEAFNAQSGGDLAIGDITNSNFTASTAINTDGNNVVAGFYALGNDALTIGDISNSSFIANANNLGIVDGFAVKSHGDVAIGDISNSNFVANVNGDGIATGFLAYGANNLTIGNIVDSSFTGLVSEENKGVGTGLYLKGSNITVDSVEYTNATDLYKALDLHNDFNARNFPVCVNNKCH